MNFSLSRAHSFLRPLPESLPCFDMKAFPAPSYRSGFLGEEKKQFLRFSCNKQVETCLTSSRSCRWELRAQDTSSLAHCDDNLAPHRPRCGPTELQETKGLEVKNCSSIGHGFVSGLGSQREHCESGAALGRLTLAFVTAACISLAAPSVTIIDGSIFIGGSIAYAQPLDQMRQAALFLERLAETRPSVKVLDKVMTVISGQTVVTPETLEGLKSIIEQEKEDRDWKENFADNVENLWSTAFDVVSQLNPLSLVESAGTSIQGLVEAAAERFAAFELSTLVALGERWLLWTPFIVFPMYWQMSRNNTQDKRSDKEAQSTENQPSEAMLAKAVKVREELERIELKAELLDLVYSVGKVAWQPSSGDQYTKRKQIDDTLLRLQELNPMESLSSSTAAVAAPSAIPPSTHRSSIAWQPSSGDQYTKRKQIDDTLLRLQELNPMESLSSSTAAVAAPSAIPPSTHRSSIDGDWLLIYVSQSNNESRQQQIPQFPSVDLPGLEVSNLRQKLWRKELKTVPPTVAEAFGEQIVAKNTAQVRLGPLGVVELSVQGSWENLKDGKGARVFFDTFSAKPLELLGAAVREDLPPLSVAIPRTFQTSGEWQVVYLDNSLRINRGRTGQLYLFRKAAI